ncbi:MAG: acyltransferase [Acidimicrobiales bacterium]
MPAPPSHRPHLDGLRSFAVYAVVLFHAGLASFDGGYLGVDVFFVLSGYLVTQTLLRDVDRHGGVRFRRFYARRARRLLPASAVALLATAVVYRSVAAPGQAEEAIRSFQAAFLYVANWYFIKAASGYFGAAVADNPLLHFWSLAVEEQFYLVWPLLLTGVLALAARTRRARAVSIGTIAVLAAASLALALALQGAHPDRAYFGTDTRAYQLLAGALLAMLPRVAARLGERSPRGARWLGALALAGLSVLTTSWWGIGPIRAVAATVLTLSLIAALDSEAGGPIARALSWEPIAYLGRISYGTYLWHWPVIVVLVTVWGPSPALLAGITAAVATGLAALSARLLEQPIRRSPWLDLRPRAVVTAGLATSVVCAVLVVPALLQRPPFDASRTVTASTAGSTPVPKDLHLDAVAQARFPGHTVTCIHDALGVHGGPRSGTHILLMGDSNAQMLVPVLEAMARREHLTLSLEIAGGRPQSAVSYAMSTEIKERRVRYKEDAYERVILLDPDVVVPVNVGSRTRRRPRQRPPACDPPVA